MVGERPVLRRVQHLEQRGRRIALERSAQLVDFVEQEDRVLDAGLLHAVEDAPRHRPDVGAPVAADVRLVAGAAERDAHVLAAHGAGDRLRDRRLADARRPDEEEDRAAFVGAVGVLGVGLGGFGLLRGFAGLVRGVGGLVRGVGGPVRGVEGLVRGCYGLARGVAGLVRDFKGLVRGRGALARGFGRGVDSRLLPPRPPVVHHAHREELQDPVLRVLQPVVVLVQDARRAGDVQPLVAQLAPRQFAHRLDVGADDLGLHRFAAHPLEPLQFAVDFLARGGRQFQPGDPFLQLFGIVRAVVVAEFLADRLQLFAQVHLALAVADLFLDLRVDVLLGVEHLEPPLDQRQHPPHPLFDRQRFEQGLVVAGLEIEVAGHEIGEPAGVGDAAQGLVQHLVGDAGAGAEFGRPVAELLVEGDEGEVVRVHRHEFLRRRDGGDRVILGDFDAQRDAAMEPDDQGLRAAEAVLELQHARRDADRVQAERVDLVARLPLQEGEERAVRALGRRLDGAQRVGPSDRHRHRDAGVDRHVPQDDDRQLGLGAARPRRQGRVRAGGLARQGLRFGLATVGPVFSFCHAVARLASDGALFGGAVGRGPIVQIRRGPESYSNPLRFGSVGILA